MSELEKHVKNIKIAKFEVPGIKRLQFSKNLEDSIEKVVREQDLPPHQHFPYMSFEFSENSNWRIHLLFYTRGLKLVYFAIFDVPFPIEHKEPEINQGI